MTFEAWVILAWGVLNGVCCYVLGRCHGWLLCSREHLEPAFQGWRESIELNDELIALLREDAA